MRDLLFLGIIVLSISFVVSAVNKVTIQCEFRKDDNLWSCKCSDKGVGMAVENLDGTMLICNKNANLEFINIPSTQATHRDFKHKLVPKVSQKKIHKMNSTSEVQSTTKAADVKPTENKHKGKSKHLTEVTESTTGILENLFSRILNDYDGQKVNGYNAQKVIQQSKTCPVFDRNLKPGETMKRLGCTYICDNGVFKKRDRYGKRVLLLHGTRDKFVG